MKRIKSLLLIVALVAATATFAQPAQRIVRVNVTPEHTDWLYKTGEKVVFDVNVLRCDTPCGEVAQVRYEISEDMMPPLKSGSVKLSNGHARIEAGTMQQPGFLRCRVFAKYGDREYEGLATAGFDPAKLQPVTTMPDDFDAFWDAAKAAAAKWPLDAVMTLQPERCTDKVDVYHVSFCSNGYASRFYGMLCVPKAAGTYPAILQVPGAGVRGYNGEIERASKGVIILSVGIHGIPVNLPAGVYTDLANGALKGYNVYNLDDRDNYYYKRVYMGCVRAIDFIYTLPSFNGNLATLGGSQGGALSVVTAALDNRVKALVCYYPALSDMAGYTANRAGGWPHMFRQQEARTPAKLNTARYYDVVNFARRVQAPGFYTFGYNDMVCPPTTTYSVYNVVEAPKQLMVAENTGHYTYAEQTAAAWGWVTDYLKSLAPTR